MRYLLISSETSAAIRPATESEFEESQKKRKSGDNGVIETSEGLCIAIDPMIIEPIESIGSVTRALSAGEGEEKC
jgi:hypothetical protein